MKHLRIILYTTDKRMSKMFRRSHFLTEKKNNNKETSTLAAYAPAPTKRRLLFSLKAHLTNKWQVSLVPKYTANLGFCLLALPSHQTKNCESVWLLNLVVNWRNASSSLFLLEFSSRIAECFFEFFDILNHPSKKGFVSSMACAVRILRTYVTWSTYDLSPRPLYSFPGTASLMNPTVKF